MEIVVVIRISALSPIRTSPPPLLLLPPLPPPLPVASYRRKTWPCFSFEFRSKVKDSESESIFRKTLRVSNWKRSSLDFVVYCWVYCVHNALIVDCRRAAIDSRRLHAEIFKDHNYSVDQIMPGSSLIKVGQRASKVDLRPATRLTTWNAFTLNGVIYQAALVKQLAKYRIAIATLFTRDWRNGPPPSMRTYDRYQSST